MSTLRKKKKFTKRKKGFWASIGPGVITGAADDDPSGVATYTIAGAQAGTTLLWTALLTWPLMAAVQMMCARVGLASGEGLAAGLRKKIPRPLLLLVCAALLVANVLNVGADLAAMADAGRLLTGLNKHGLVFVFAILISAVTVQFHYQQIAGILKWLALFLFSYIITAFLIGFSWNEVLTALFQPTLPRNQAQWSLLVAILGTTISPYLFFWQASQEVEEEKADGCDTLRKRRGASHREILLRKIDVGVGTFFSNLVMFFIILTAALTLHKNGLTTIETSEQAAEALRPLAGRLAATVYTLGLLGVGCLAIPTLTGSAAYALAETFDWNQGLDAKPSQARAFYTVVVLCTLAAVAVDYSGLNPVKALYWSAVVNGVLAPFLLLGVLAVACDGRIMCGQTSPWLERLSVGAATLLLFGAGIAMFAMGG